MPVCVKSQFVEQIAKPVEAVNGQDERRINAPPLTAPPVFAAGQSRRESPKMALRHAITALLSCCFKCACLPRRQPHFRSKADRAYNTLHFASKVVCKGASPFENPGQQNRLSIQHRKGAGYSACFVVSSPVSWSACSSLQTG